MSQYNDNDSQHDFVQDNSVLSNSEKLIFQRQAGLYMIHCLVNNYRYYGESDNLSSRVAGHKYRLRNQTHWLTKLQNDWNNFGQENFQFVALEIGSSWQLKEDRLAKEKQLIESNRDVCYNIFSSWSERAGNKNPFYQKRHSEDSKKRMSFTKKGRPNRLLGRKISIRGKTYASIAEASRALGHSRRLIRERVNNQEDFFDWRSVIENDDLT